MCVCVQRGVGHAVVGRRIPRHVLRLAIVDNVSKLDVALVLKFLKVLLALAVGAWCEAKLCKGVVRCVVGSVVGFRSIGACVCIAL